MILLILMFKNSRFTLFCVFIFCSFISMGQSKDDNVIISGQEDTYRYLKNGNKDFQIEEKSVIEYTCIGDVKPITVYKFYSATSEIKKVRVKGIKRVVPRYEMYQSKSLFYSDTRVCYFSLPFSKKNESAQVTFVKKYSDLQSLFFIPISDDQFIKKKVIRFEVPDWMEIDLIERNFDSSIQKDSIRDDKNRTNTYIYTVENQKAIKQEENMPRYAYPYIYVIPRSVRVDGLKQPLFDNFDHLYAWLHNYVLLSGNKEDIVKQKAQEITNNCKTDDEKIKALFSWVQDNIRYLANEYGIEAYKPDAAHEVIRKKYGDCKGMSNLLKCLLHAQGFDARLVWLGTKEISIDSSVPLPLGDHMICALKCNNTIYYLDPTAKFMPFGQYPQYIQGKTVLIEDDKNYLLEKVPILPPSSNTESLSCEFTIEDQSLRCKSKIEYSGESKQDIMSAIQSTKNIELMSALKTFLERGNVQDKVSDIELSGANSLSEKMELTYNEVRKSNIKKHANELFIGMDSFRDFNTMGIDTVKRQNDYLFTYKRHIVRDERLLIPKGYRLKSYPSNLKVEEKGYSFVLNYTIVDNKIIYHKEITILEPWLKKADFSTWNSNIEKLKKAYLEQVILIQTSDTNED